MRHIKMFKQIIGYNAGKFISHHRRFYAYLSTVFQRDRDENSIRLQLFIAIVKKYSECAYSLFGGNRGEVLLPFHGHQVLFLGVAFFAAGHDITFGTFASPGNRHNMVHGEFSREKFSAAIVTAAFGALALPPLGVSEVTRFIPLALDIRFGEIISKRLHTSNLYPCSYLSRTTVRSEN